MLVTVEEARKIVCQKSIAASSFVNCLGPRCMAWRWLGGYQDKPDAKGYCGEAGKPE